MHFLIFQSCYISLNFTDKNLDQLINPLSIQYVEIKENVKDDSGLKYEQSVLYKTKNI